MLVVILTVYIVVCRATGKIPSFFGYSVITIVSDSMDSSPEDNCDYDIPRGTYILIRKTSADAIKEGDVITFYSTDARIAGAPNTHRVVDIVENADNTLSFRTQGVNKKTNPAPDENLTEENNIIGKYVRNLNVLTFMMKLLTNKLVLIGLIILLGALIVIPRALGRKKKES